MRSGADDAGRVLSLWRRLPTLIRAILAGGAAATLGTIPWAFFAGANLQHWPTIPWAIVPTAAYLWLYWRYLRGEGWPASTAAARRASARANALSGDIWGLAIFAGVLGLLALLTFNMVFNRVVHLPTQRTDDFSRVPIPTLLLLLLMSAVVAGVVEETSFRGYMQGPIERRHGPVVAIVVSGTLFGFAHFAHPEVGLTLIPYYLAVATVYGALAYITNSVYPSMVLHAGGNIWSSLGLLAQDRSEWQAPAQPQPLIWETGADISFWMELLLFLVMTGVAGLAYASLAREVRRDSPRAPT